MKQSNRLFKTTSYQDDEQNKSHQNEEIANEKLNMSRNNLLDKRKKKIRLR